METSRGVDVASKIGRVGVENGELARWLVKDFYAKFCLGSLVAELGVTSLNAHRWALAR